MGGVCNAAGYRIREYIEVLEMWGLLQRNFLIEVISSLFYQISNNLDKSCAIYFFPHCSGIINILNTLTWILFYSAPESGRTSKQRWDQQGKRQKEETREVCREGECYPSFTNLPILVYLLQCFSPTEYNKVTPYYYFDCRHWSCVIMTIIM